MRVESRASELYPYVDFSDCDTEYDATIKLLNTSGVPYPVSEALTVILMVDHIYSYLKMKKFVPTKVWFRL